MASEHTSTPSVTVLTKDQFEQTISPYVTEKIASWDDFVQTWEGILGMPQRQGDIPARLVLKREARLQTGAVISFEDRIIKPYFRSGSPISSWSNFVSVGSASARSLARGTIVSVPSALAKMQRQASSPGSPASLSKHLPKIHELKRKDYLELCTHKDYAPQTLRMLNKNGDMYPHPERIMFSCELVKINRKGTRQVRWILMTTKAIYNLKPKKPGTAKRRIEFKDITAITLSRTSNEFALHIPDEYDYHYDAQNNPNYKEEFCQLAKQLYAILATNPNYKGVQDDKKLKVFQVDDADLSIKIKTKPQAKLMSRAARQERRRQLLNMRTESDDEDEVAVVMRPLEVRQGGEQRISEIIKPTDFDYLSVIGRGGFGKVCLVQRKGQEKGPDGKEKVYAMKILRKQHLRQTEQEENAKHEGQILASMDHPFLMHLRWAFETEKSMYFVMDFYQGGELFFHLSERRRFPMAVACLWTAQIALALNHLHEHSIVYRDLKPENVLIAVDGHICLTDFGLAKNLSNQQDNQAHTFCGTPEYLAPEVIDPTNFGDRGGHACPVDWWALGILLFELVVGCVPFYSDDVNSMYMKILTEEPRYDKLKGEATKLNFQSMVKKFLVKNPQERLGTKRGLEEIKEQRFFKTLDWQRLYHKGYNMPFAPAVTSITDVKYFDKQFTNEVAADESATDALWQQKAQEASKNMGGGGGND